MFSSFTTAFMGDSRIAPALAALVALIVILGLAYFVYRLAFAARLRPSGGARGRAPRLGVVDVFGLDGQRQLVIVRRDNIEHLLLLGGPNDLVVEPNIQRAANGRDAKSDAHKPAGEGEPPAPIPAPIAAPPRTVAPRRDAARSFVDEAADIELGVPPLRARTLPTPRQTPDAPLPDGARAEPAKPFMPVEPARPFTPEPSRIVAAEASRMVAPPEPSRIVAADPPPRPVTIVEPSRSALIVEPPKPVAPVEPPKPAEPPPAVKPAEPAMASEPAAKIAEPPRKPIPPAPPRQVSATSRPALPPPITPLRARVAPDVAPESMKVAPPSGETVKSAEVRPFKSVEPAIVTKPPPEAAPKPVAPVAANAETETTTAPKAKKEEAFYDLESLEAEMARLLGRDP